MVVVAKFGGGCGKDGPSLEKVVDIIISDKAILEHKNGDASGGRQRRVITISAPGDDGRGKITDLLKNAGKKFLDTGTIDSVLIGKVWERYEGIADYLGLDQGFLAPYKQMMIDAIGQRSSKYKLLNKMINMKNAAMDMFRYGRNAEVQRKKYLDSVMRLGELINAAILVEKLGKEGKNAKLYLPEEIGIVTDSNFGSAQLLSESYAKISNFLERKLQDTDEIIVIPGFYGIDRYGSYTTLPRGGTDLTGSILAKSAKAWLYENWTHVDGVKRVDPTIFPKGKDIQTIGSMCFEEMEELGITGTGVLLFDAVLPLIGANGEDGKTILQIRNFDNLENPGTIVYGNGKGAYNGITGISRETCYVLSVKKRSIKNVKGYGSELFREIAKHSAYKYSFDAIDEITVVFPASEAEKLGTIADSITSNTILNPDKVEIREMGILGIVADGMANQKGISKDLTTFLYGGGVNILRQNQGSDRCILFFVDPKDLDNGARHLYQKIFVENRGLPPQRYAA
ncbi:hypothetical protein J4458_01820 [Candidatus Woesearchaeota archaeon]|nr:hypothetical protein [Candidatus Woesearchaeota archaeon]